MIEKVISYHSRRFVVEVGRNEYDMNPYLSGVTVWAFERAFHELRDAESYAERIAEDNAHVRIVDRGEVAWG